ANLGTGSGELVDNARFPPHAVPLRAEPLRPIVGKCVRGRECHICQKRAMHGKLESRPQAMTCVDHATVSVRSKGCLSRRANWPSVRWLAGTAHTQLTLLYQVI